MGSQSSGVKGGRETSDRAPDSIRDWLGQEYEVQKDAWPGVEGHAFNFSSLEAEAGRVCEFPQSQPSLK